MTKYSRAAVNVVAVARALSIETFAVGVGTGVSMVGLSNLASPGNVFLQDSFDQLPRQLLSFARVQFQSQRECFEEGLGRERKERNGKRDYTLYI